MFDLAQRQPTPVRVMAHGEVGEIPPETSIKSLIKAHNCTCSSTILGYIAKLLSLGAFRRGICIELSY